MVEEQAIPHLNIEFAVLLKEIAVTANKLGILAEDLKNKINNYEEVKND